MAMNEYSIFPKASGHLLGVGGVLPLCRDAVGVFYSSSRLGIVLSSVILLVTLYVMVCFFVQ